MRLFFRLLAACVLLICLSGMLLTGVSETDDALRLVCLNIGKADCSLLLWQDSAYLIDAGYELTYPALKTALAQYGVTRLNGVFLTHCHVDHQGGLLPLAQSDVAVDAWYAPRLYYDVKEGEHGAVLAAAYRGQEVTWLNAGDEITLPDGAAFTVLGPLTVNEENENNNSLVMRFSCGAGSILFTGDMKEDEEEDLLAANAFSPADLLKVGHHGDNNATGKQLVQAVLPQAAVIFTDSREEPDTPAASTVKRLTAAGAKVYVTQDAQDAYLFTIQDHTVTAEDVSWFQVPARASGVSIAMDLTDDRLIIRNGSESSLSLDGWALYSTKGNETLRLDGLSVDAGGSLIIGTKTTKGDMDVRWNEKKVWNQKKRDVAIFYDAYGRVVACTDNGLEE